MPDFKIDRKNKTFVFDDGEVLPIPEKDQREVLRTATGKNIKTERKERLGKIKEAGGSFGAFGSALDESFLGNPGRQTVDYLGSAFNAITPKEGQEELGYIDRVLDTFYAKQEAERENLAEIEI